MKHAYLILSHKSDSLFEHLLGCLDHELNDLFIHMDKRNKGYDEEHTKALLSYSNVYHCASISCNWGAFSLVQAELLLLELATRNGHYDYYHLISGSDLPIKPQEYIHKFFEKEKGKEFVRFQSSEFSFEDRIRYYYPLQETFGKKPSYIARKLLSIQQRLGIQRNKGIKFQKGTQWFSITDSFARYVLSQKDFVNKVFHDTLCPDELFIQTLILNSEFISNLYHQNFDNDTKAIMRHIDWTRGEPYVFRDCDYEELVTSEMLFARKFDPEIDSRIIDKISKYVSAGR